MAQQEIDKKKIEFANSFSDIFNEFATTSTNDAAKNRELREKLGTVKYNQLRNARESKKKKAEERAKLEEEIQQKLKSQDTLINEIHPHILGLGKLLPSLQQVVDTLLKPPTPAPEPVKETPATTQSDGKTTTITEPQKVTKDHPLVKDSDKEEIPTDPEYGQYILPITVAIGTGAAVYGIYTYKRKRDEIESSKEEDGQKPQTGKEPRIDPFVETHGRPRIRRN